MRQCLCRCLTCNIVQVFDMRQCLRRCLTCNIVQVFDMRQCVQVQPVIVRARQKFEEAGKMAIEEGDHIAVIDGK